MEEDADMTNDKEGDHQTRLPEGGDMPCSGRSDGDPRSSGVSAVEGGRAKQGGARAGYGRARQQREHPVEVLQKMLDKALTTLLDTPDAGPAWKRLVVRLTWWASRATGGTIFPPQPLSKSAIRNGLIGCRGKGGEHLGRRSGCAEATRCSAVPPHSSTCAPCAPITWSGVGTLLKNYIMFSPRPSDYYGNACENLGALWQLPQVKGKTRLNILVMLTPLFHGAGRTTSRGSIPGIIGRPDREHRPRGCRCHGRQDHPAEEEPLLRGAEAHQPADSPHRRGRHQVRPGEQPAGIHRIIRLGEDRDILI